MDFLVTLSKNFPTPECRELSFKKFSGVIAQKLAPNSWGAALDLLK